MNGEKNMKKYIILSVCLGITSSTFTKLSRYAVSHSFAHKPVNKENILLEEKKDTQEEQIKEEVVSEQLSEIDQKALAIYRAYQTKDKKIIHKALREQGVQWEKFYVFNGISSDASEILKKAAEQARKDGDYELNEKLLF